MGQMRFPRIESASRSTSAWVSGEILYDTNSNRLYYGDGASVGGVLIATGNGLSSISFAGNTTGTTSAGNGFLTLAGGPNITLSCATAVGGIAVSVSGGAGGGGAGYSGGVSTGGNTLGTTGMASSQLVLVGGNNITLSQSLAAGIATVTISGAAIPAQSNQTVGLYAVGNTTGESSSTTRDARTISLHGAGLASVGYSAGSAIVSVTAAAQTNQTVGLYAVGQTTGESSSTTRDARTLSLHGAGLVSVGYSAGSAIISATAAAQTNQTVGLYAVGNTTGESSSTTRDARTVSLHGAGLASVGYSAGSAIVSVTAAAQTNQTLGLYAVSNTTGQSSSSTFDARTLSFHGAGIASVGYSNGSVVVSVPAAGGAGDGFNRIAAGTQTAGTLATVVFSNSNGISFGMSDSSVVTASYTVPTQSNQTVGLYAVGQTTGESSSTTRDARTLSLHGAGLVSVGYSAGSAIVSATSAAQTVQTLGLYAVSNTTGQSSSSTFDARTLSFHGAGVASVGYSNGSVVVSVPAGGGGDGFNRIAAGTQTAGTLATVVFSDSHGMVFGMSDSSVVTASCSSLVPGSTVLSVGSDNDLGTQTTRFARADHVHAGLHNVSVVGNTAGNTSAGNGSLVLGGGPNITLSGSTAAGGMTLSISGGAGGGAAFSAGVSTIGNTAGNTGTVSNQLVLAAINGLVLSQSTAAGGATVTISAPVYTFWDPNVGQEMTFNQLGNSQFQFQPVTAPAVSFNRIHLPIWYTAATNSTNSQTVSMYCGIYTKNVSTLSLLTSYSNSIAVTHSGTVRSSLHNAMRHFTIGATSSLSPGNYYLGIMSITTSAGGNASISQMALTNLASSFSGIFGVGQSVTNQLTQGLGFYSALSGAVPGSVAFSHINGQNNFWMRRQVIYFIEGYV